VPLGRLARPESLILLHRHRPDLPPDDPGLDGITEELGDLPLALELAGSYLARYRHEPIGTPAAYLAELRGEDLLAHASLRIEDPQAPGQSRTLTGHERDVARTFEVSLRRLQPDNPIDALARRIFAGAAWLAPGLSIPRHLLKLCIGLAPEDADGARRFTPALERLLDLALLERASEAGGAVILHRLVAAFARARLEQASTARQALEEAVVKEADRLLVSNDPRPFRDWAGHLLAVALAAGRDRTDAAIELLNAAGSYSRIVADFEASEAMLQEAAEQAQALLGPDHPEVARTLGSLGIVQRRRGDLAAAEASLTRALAVQEKVFGPDHPEVARTLTNLGIVQLERGDLAAAEVSQIRALALKEKVFGPDHPEVARTLGSLGIVQSQRGDLAAEVSLTRALAVQEKVYGPDHSEVARTLGNLGIVQHMLGRNSDARASYTRAVAIFASRLGEHHPNTIQARRLLGELDGTAKERRNDHG
jgi:Tfp pilus assembly protein PilF